MAIKLDNAAFAQRLRTLLKGTTQTELADQLGVPQPQIARYLAGRVPDPPVLVRLAGALGCTTDWLLTGREQRPLFISEEPATYGQTKGRLLPILNWVQAGKMTASIDPYPYAGVAEDYLAANVKGKRCFALKVRGDSMEPEFREGDVIVVDPDRQPQAGDFVVVKSDEEGEATFKKYVRLRGEAYLRPVNQQNYPDIKLTDTHRLVGKVIRLHRSY